MPPELVGQILGPLGLVIGCLWALWAFVTERIVSGTAYKRVLDQNEALLRRLDRLLAVSGRAVDVVDKATRERPDGAP